MNFTDNNNVCRQKRWKVGHNPNEKIGSTLLQFMFHMCTKHCLQIICKLSCWGKLHKLTANIILCSNLFLSFSVEISHNLHLALFLRKYCRGLTKYICDSGTGSTNFHKKLAQCVDHALCSYKYSNIAFLHILRT